jgi:MoaA/NifB/PqqE/SkfB family radical SAM enzyme
MGWHRKMRFPDDLYRSVPMIGPDGEVFPCSYSPPEWRLTARIMVAFDREVGSS